MRFCLAAALMLAVLGAFFYWFVYGYSFLGVICWCAALLALMIYGLKKLKRTHPRLAKRLQIALAIVLGAGICTAAATGGWIIANAHTDEPAGNAYAIVLGAGVNGTTPSQSLRERMDAAISYLNQYPDATCIVSGGQGSGEDLTEAQCMENYLLAHGIAKERIWQEPCATNTQENLEFSLQLIQYRTGQLPQSVTVVTSEYHLLRAKRYGRACGVQTYGYAAKTQIVPYRILAFLREIPAVWKQLLGA